MIPEEIATAEAPGLDIPFTVLDKLNAEVAIDTEIDNRLGVRG